METPEDPDRLDAPIPDAVEAEPIVPTDDVVVPQDIPENAPAEDA